MGTSTRRATLSLFLVIALIVCMFPLSAFANDTDAVTGNDENISVTPAAEEVHANAPYYEVELRGVEPGYLEDEVRAYLDYTYGADVIDFSEVNKLEVFWSTLNEVDFDFICTELTGLDYLALEHSGIPGNISGLTNLQNLEFLLLTETKVSGDLSVLSGLTNLRDIRLFDTGVTGKLSDLAGLPIYYLDLTRTAVTGDLSDLKVFPDLYTVHLSDTDVEGTIASLRGCTNLQSLIIRNSQVEGNLSDIADLDALRDLCLLDSKVEGNLLSLEKMVNLYQLDLSGPKITGDLSSLKEMTGLSYLSLKDTQVEGDIGVLEAFSGLVQIIINSPQVEGSLSNLHFKPQLTFVDLHDTTVTGSVEFVSSAPYLYYLDLSNTQATGNLLNLRDTKELLLLNLQNTAVTGDIAALSKLENLSVLDLSGSHVYGAPSELARKVTNLTELDLSDLNITLDSIHFKGAPHAVPVPVKDQSADFIAPQGLVGGSFDPATGMVTWNIPKNYSGILSYTFSTIITLGNVSSEYSGTVYQPFTKEDVPVPPVPSNELPATGDSSGATLLCVGLCALALFAGLAFAQVRLRRAQGGIANKSKD